MKKRIWQDILLVREKSPLVHSITNYVVMNNTANALLAAGASPVMAHAHSEMADMVSIASALVINMGTLDEYWTESIHRAIDQANELSKPWVFDPVGAGATPYRDKVAVSILEKRPPVIRGNASEIMSLTNSTLSSSKGVDSSNDSTEALDAAIRLNKKFGSVVCISGETDLIISEKGVEKIANGNPMMTKVTGLGCTATAMIGAFTGCKPDDLSGATVSAMALMGVAGEIAVKGSSGPGSLQVHFLDKLYNLEQKEFEAIFVEIK